MCRLDRSDRPVDFELTDEQVELQALARDVAVRECPTSLLRAVIDRGEDDQRLWSTYVELDWLSLTIPEADGGMGLGPVELVVVLEELGYVADPTPLLATTSQYLPLIRSCPDDELRRTLLSKVCGGLPGAALDGSGFAIQDRAGGIVVTGMAENVLDADRADEIAICFRDHNGAGVAVVETSAAQITRAATFDPTLHVADVAFDGVAVPVERTWRIEEAVLGLACVEALAGLSATMVGASRRVFDLALDHLRERKQFGVPIGSFQALKHMAVDAFVALERARALHQFAALVVAERDDRWRTAGSMAKAAAGDCQRLVSQHGVQFFGGLGYTWENDLHLFVRRAKAGEMLLGSAAHHREIVASEARRSLSPELVG